MKISRRNAWGLDISNSRGPVLNAISLALITFEDASTMVHFLSLQMILHYYLGGDFHF